MPDGSSCAAEGLASARASSTRIATSAAQMARIPTIASRNRLSRRRTKRPAQFTPPADRRAKPTGRVEAPTPCGTFHARARRQQQGRSRPGVAAEPLQQVHARMTVLGQLEGALGGADGGTRAVADDAVEPAGIEPPGRQ